MLNTPLPPAPEDAAIVLTQALAQLRAGGQGMPRDAVLGLFRRHLARIQQVVRDDFETYRMAGVEAAQRLADLTDGVVRALFEHAVEDATAGHGLTDRIAITATGGYGRRMLAPFSDIDLLFLAPDEPEPATLRVIEFMLYFMWDLGLKVGHATRSIAHCLTDADEDVTIRTSLLDARIIAGLCSRNS
jgi:[protein-PII] uridylyltransferase